MEQDRFDDLARLIATKTSRRQVLKVLAGAAVGGMMGGRLSSARAASARAACAQFCNQTFGEDTYATSQCLKDAKRNPSALCYSACNGGGGTLCGGPSYSTTTCCDTGTCCNNGTCLNVCSGGGCPGCGSVSIQSYGGATCAKPCTTGADCIDIGAGCVQDVSGASYCGYPAGFEGVCTTDADCNPGSICQANPPGTEYPGTCVTATC